MQVNLEDGRTGVLAALDALLVAVRDLPDAAFLAPSACLGWNVGDVLVHVHLGLQEMLLGLVSPTEAPPDTDAASYWQLFPPGDDADDLAGARFVRLVGSAYRRPSGVVGHLRPTADGVARAVAAARPGALAFQGRVLATGDFLATWAVELAVHHLDLTRELDLPPPAPQALLLARRTVEALAGGALPSHWPDDRAVLLGTGRATATASEQTALADLPRRLPVLG